MNPQKNTEPKVVTTIISNKDTQQKRLAGGMPALTMQYEFIVVNSQSVTSAFHKVV